MAIRRQGRNNQSNKRVREREDGGSDNQRGGRDGCVQGGKEKVKDCSATYPLSPNGNKQGVETVKE